jgi:hypothetical protein
MKFSLPDIYKEDLTEEIAKFVGSIVGVVWEKVNFTPSDLKDGILVELEHGSANPKTNITHDDLILTTKIALAHLFENSKYYRYLAKLGL